MKVLFNLPSISLYPDRFQMLKHLAPKLDKLIVVTNSIDKRYMNDIPDNMNVLELPASKFRFLIGLLFKSGYRDMDIIHDTFGYFLPLGPLARISKSRKYITSVYGSSAGWYRKATELGVKDEGELKLHKKLIRREKLNSSFCDAFLMNSQSFVQDYVDTFGRSESKIYIVPNCITIHKEYQFKEPGNDFNILYVGHVSQMKGINVLLEAFQNLSERGTNLKLTVIGKQTSQGKELIGSRNWKNVKFIDSVPHNELAKHFQAADLYVHPSYQEGMPRVVMEALSFGVPVIAADLPGIRTMDSTGQFIKFMKGYDPADLISMLSEEISSPRKNQVFFQNSRKHMNQFSPENTANKIFDIYNKL